MAELPAVVEISTHHGTSFRLRSSGDAELVRPGEEDPAALCHLASARFGEFGVYDLAVEDNLSETR